MERAKVTQEPTSEIKSASRFREICMAAADEKEREMSGEKVYTREEIAELKEQMRMGTFYGERDLLDKYEHLLADNERLRGLGVVTCVYCGLVYGPANSTPTSRAAVLTEHIAQCPKHPMTALKKENAALREQQRWIPVSERLPDTLNFYDVFRSNPEPIPGWLKLGHGTIMTSCYSPDEGEWIDLTFGEAEDITHWRPLPEPPLPAEPTEEGPK